MVTELASYVKYDERYAIVIVITTYTIANAIRLKVSYAWVSCLTTVYAINDAIINSSVLVIVEKSEINIEKLSNWCNEWRIKKNWRWGKRKTRKQEGGWRIIKKRSIIVTAIIIATAITIVIVYPYWSQCSKEYNVIANHWNA